MDMLKRVMILLLMAASLTLAMQVPAIAQGNDRSLKELRIRQQEENKLRQEAAFTSDVCGTRISASINWGSASNWPDSGKGIAKICDGALGAIEALCRGGKKSNVQARIKSFQCGGNGSGPALSGSTLRFGARPGANAYGPTKSYLDSRL